MLFSVLVLLLLRRAPTSRLIISPPLSTVLLVVGWYCGAFKEVMSRSHCIVLLQLGTIVSVMGVARANLAVFGWGLLQSIALTLQHCQNWLLSSFDLLQHRCNVDQGFSKNG
ncbi:hypothetical protein PIB30_093930 [Stylosanthes scabra]|uniref:Uncharacterized protein n=1 Tax=Stylosanthes scabra TaxID=79078 RepID=A0ABU6WTK4_9FABA|nr:hypothetical protein [Stylosanthes scabra]